MTSIEWVRNADGSRGKTWNPIVGCSVLTPGCTNCYAMKMAARLEVMGNVSHYAGATKKVKGSAVWTGKLALAPDNIIWEPLKRKKPTTYFLNSMGDLFHENVPDKWIVLVFAVMACSPQHTFQILTKRAARMREFCAQKPIGLSTGVLEICRHDKNGYPIATPATWPLPNVWLGVSTERQQEADERIPHLLQTPAAVRFISAEPLLGPIDLNSLAETRLSDGSGQYASALHGRITHRSANGYADHPSCLTGTVSLRCLAETPKLDWVIVGGESGPSARPMHPDWARSLRDQCCRADVSYFFKQWGQWKDGSDFAADKSVKAVMDDGRVSDPDLASLTEHDRLYSITVRNPTLMRNVGKKSAGRLLDGREHNDLPNLAAKPQSDSAIKAGLSQ